MLPLLLEMLREDGERDVLLFVLLLRLFKPLFPKTVQAKLRFKRAPVLASLAELTPLTTDSGTLARFLEEVDELLL